MAVFNNLPSELRTAIWELCLPDPEAPEIYFFDESDFERHDDDDDDAASKDASSSDSSEWETEPEVLVGFPTIMHLCAESRAFARSRTSLREGQLTPRTGRAVDVPCRPFRPATDVLLAPDFDAFAVAVLATMDAEYRAVQAGAAPATEGPALLAERIGHLAVCAETFPGPCVEPVVGRMTALRRLSLVFFPPGGGDLERAKKIWKGSKDVAAAAAAAAGVDPARRCALRPFGRATGLAAPWRRKRAENIEAFLSDVEMHSSLWELDDQDKAPWDPETGEWLFDLEAVELVSAAGRLY